MFKFILMRGRLYNKSLKQVRYTYKKNGYDIGYIINVGTSSKRVMKRVSFDLLNKVKNKSDLPKELRNVIALQKDVLLSDFNEKAIYKQMRGLVFMHLPMISFFTRMYIKENKIFKETKNNNADLLKSKKFTKDFFELIDMHGGFSDEIEEMENYISIKDKYLLHLIIIIIREEIGRGGMGFGMC